jgi:hypothetical protein
MAMTKAEAKRLADLDEALALARSMRWPDYNMPAPMTEADIKTNLVEGGIKYRGQPEKVARGYFANSHSGRVTYGCSDGFSHSSEGDTTNTHHMGRMYANEADAWRTVRYEMTLRFAKELARVDQKIDETEPRP